MTIHGRRQPWLTLTVTWHHGWTQESSTRSRCYRVETRQRFRSWQFVLKASLGLLDTAYSTDLPQVEALRSPMTQPDIAETRARSEKLYFILALTTADHAQVIVQQVRVRSRIRGVPTTRGGLRSSDVDARFIDDRGYSDGQVHVKKIIYHSCKTGGCVSHGTSKRWAVLWMTT